MSTLSTIRLGRLFGALTSPRKSRKQKGVLSYLELRRQRRALACMDTAQLNDLGLTREEAMIEAARPIWDAPNHWMGS